MALALCFLTSFFKLCLCLAIIGITVGQRIPDRQSLMIEELENLLINFGGANAAGMAIGVTPCTAYTDSTTGVETPNNPLGRQTAAQWIRTAFHDFATANVAARTGGLDASVGYETARPENVGPGIPDSIFFFSFFVNAAVSMADIIALGAVISIASCGGPYVPLRGGRIDATSAGPAGVCEPETDLDTTFSKFQAAGFNKADTIALTACGHSMGGVHHHNFPQVVNEAAVSATNTDGRADFDESVAVFDVKTVNEYLTGTGKQGGPLVTTSNKTVASDLRLFESDKNETMKRLGRSADEFASTCSTLIARMIDTVPERVSLSPAIEPALLKLFNTTLSVAWNGDLQLSSTLRYLDKDNRGPAPDSLKVSLISRSGDDSKISIDAKRDPNADAGTNIFGPAHSYPVSLKFPASSGLSGVSVQNERLPLQDSLFVAYSLSSISPGFATFGPNFLKPVKWTFNITAALRDDYNPIVLDATIKFPTSQKGSFNPLIDTTTSKLQNIGRAGPFSLYSSLTTVELTGAQLFQTSVDIAAQGVKAEVQFFKLFQLFTSGAK